jgi:hypothetical protein
MKCYSFRVLELLTILAKLFGGFAGACSVLGNTPLDVVKTK